MNTENLTSNDSASTPAAHRSTTNKTGGDTRKTSNAHMKKNTTKGTPCHCKPGQQRDNCPDCEGTGYRIDFAAIRAGGATQTKASRGSYRTKDGKAQIEWELKAGENGLEFSASGDYAGGSGQCIDKIALAYPGDTMVQRIAKVWEVYHLNGMNAGLPAQTRAVEAWRKLNAGNSRANDYGETIKMLEAANLYEIPLPEGAQATGGFPPEVERGERGYRYGERWVYLPIPADILAEIESWSVAPMPRESLHEAKAKAFLADNGLKFRATLSDSKPAPWDESGGYRPHFRVTVSRNEPKGARLAFDFWGAVDSREVSAYTVLSCIASDIHTPETFADYCSEYGEDADSRKALQTFNRADRFARRLRAFFTSEEQEALSEIQ